MFVVCVLILVSLCCNHIVLFLILVFLKPTGLLEGCPNSSSVLEKVTCVLEKKLCFLLSRYDVQYILLLFLFRLVLYLLSTYFELRVVCWSLIVPFYLFLLSLPLVLALIGDCYIMWHINIQNYYIFNLHCGL